MYGFFVCLFYTEQYMEFVDRREEVIVENEEFHDKIDFWKEEVHKGNLYLEDWNEWKATEELKEQEWKKTDLAVDGFVRKQEQMDGFVVPIVLTTIIKQHAGCVRLPAYMGAPFDFTVKCSTNKLKIKIE